LIIHKGSLEKHQKTQLDHVPIVPPLVFHNVESPCHMTVAIVAKEVVHAMSIDSVGLQYRFVPSFRSSRKLADDVHFEVSGGPSKRHSWQGSGTVRAHIVGSLKIVRVTPAVGDPHVPDEWEDCGDRVERRPQNGKRQIVDLGGGGRRRWILLQVGCASLHIAIRTSSCHDVCSLFFTGSCNGWHRIKVVDAVTGSCVITTIDSVLGTHELPPNCFDVVLNFSCSKCG